MPVFLSTAQPADGRSQWRHSGSQGQPALVSSQHLPHSDPAGRGYITACRVAARWLQFLSNFFLNFWCVTPQFVSRVDMKYKRMNSNERVRIIYSGMPRQGSDTIWPECLRVCDGAHFSFVILSRLYLNLLITLRTFYLKYFYSTMKLICENIKKLRWDLTRYWIMI